MTACVSINPSNPPHHLTSPTHLPPSSTTSASGAWFTFLRLQGTLVSRLAWATRVFLLTPSLHSCPHSYSRQPWSGSRRQWSMKKARSQETIALPCRLICSSKIPVNHFARMTKTKQVWHSSTSFAGARKLVDSLATWYSVPDNVKDFVVKPVELSQNIHSSTKAAS